MENKFLTFIKPYLSVIDNGFFFRKPFRWLYLFFAALSLLLPIYLVYGAFNLHKAFDSREQCRIKFEIVSQKYEEVKQIYVTAEQDADQYKSESRNANQNYSQANRNAQYYSNYLQYYRQEYDNANQQAKEWLAAWQEAEKKYNSSQLEYEKIQPEYEKLNEEYNLANQEYQIAIDKYHNIAPKGAFHTAGISVRAIVALILFSILSFFIGLINFQIFWDRKSTLNLTFKDHDEFTAIPVIAHYIQTIGESIGTYIGVMGSFTILIALVFKVCFGTYGLGRIFIPDIENLSNNLIVGIPYLILPIIAGFMTIVLFRVIAEGIKAIVVIANNTRE